MKLYDIPNKEILKLSDYLAKDRTDLANERTLLAYVRTALGFFSTGIAGIKFFGDSAAIFIIGLVFIVVSPLFAGFGLMRYVRMKRKMESVPDNDLVIGPK